MAPRETENNAYAKFWGDKQRALCYVMVFLEWSIKHVYHNVYLASFGRKFLTDLIELIGSTCHSCRICLLEFFYRF